MSRVIEAPQLDDEETQRIYEWIDDIPLSRPKRNIMRDFADGAMIAEVIGHYFPRLVELHNYPQAHSQQQKLTNWNTLNAKVFRKMGFQISRSDIEKVVTAVPEAIERVLGVVQQNIQTARERGVEHAPQPKVHQPQPRGAAPREKLPAQSGSSAKEKDMIIQELRETIEIMETKIAKLEQLAKLKDSKIQLLTNKLGGNI